MCTITAQFTDNRLIVTMNRDEFKVRAPERPPSRHRHGDRERMLFPVDTQGGGTWIGVNRQGVCACLINQYLTTEGGDRFELAEEAKPRRTRGEIVPLILVEENWSAVKSRMTMLEAARYAPFNLIVFSVGKPWIELDWPGEGASTVREDRGEWFMVSSSSWNTDSVLAWRRQKFEEWLLAPRFLGTLPTFHLLQPRDMEEWAPLMNRATTHTRSITQVEIDRDVGEVVMRYWPRPSVNTDIPESVVAMELNSEQVWEL